MKISHIFSAVSLIIMLAAASPAWAFPTGDSNINDNGESHATALKSRLDEIRAIDKSKLAPEERKALRREVRAIKKELAAISGGVYLSVGALLLIALLLILLL